MTEKRLRNGLHGVSRRPRCEVVYPPPEGSSRTRFLTSDNVLFDIANVSVTPSTVLAKAVFCARRIVQQPLRVDPPPTPAPFSPAGAPLSPSESVLVALSHAPHHLHNVSSEPLEMALTYCYFHTSAEGRTMSTAELTARDNQFVRVSPRQLCELATAAYYLDIRNLVDLTCRAIADIISGKTAEQIRTTFHIENDLVQSLIFCQDSDVPSMPRVHTSERRNTSTTIKPSHNIDDVADTVDQEAARQKTENLNQPQPGESSIEEVENWINNASASKKSPKKRRKKKKSRPSATLPENSQTDSPSSSSRYANPLSPPPLSDIVAIEPSIASSPATALNAEDHEPAASSGKTGDFLSRNCGSNSGLQKSTSLVPEAALSDEDVVFISMTRAQHPNASKSSKESERVSKMIGDQSSMDDSTAPAHGLHSLSNPKRKLSQEEFESNEGNSVCSITSNESSVVHREAEQVHSQEDYPQPLLQPCTNNTEQQQHCKNVCSSDFSMPINCSTDAGSRQAAPQTQQGQSKQRRSDVSLRPANSESHKQENDTGTGSALGPEEPSYIRCPDHMDKEVEDFESRLGTQRPSSSPSRKHGANTLHAPQGQIRIQSQRGDHKCDRKTDETVLTENKLKEVRREAQLIEREKLYQQRADDIQKQIAELYSAREKVRDNLSFVKMELMQLRGEPVD